MTQSRHDHHGHACAIYCPRVSWPPLERFEATMQRLRALSRPDPHVYLDMIGVLPVHRRQGIATALMHAGHDWADDLGLPVALETDTEENVAFYARRGHEVIARERLPDSGPELVAMRRLPTGGSDSGGTSSGSATRSPGGRMVSNG